MSYSLGHDDQSDDDQDIGLPAAVVAAVAVGLVLAFLAGLAWGVLDAMRLAAGAM